MNESNYTGKTIKHPKLLLEFCLTAISHCHSIISLKYFTNLKALLSSLNVFLVEGKIIFH